MLDQVVWSSLESSSRMQGISSDDVHVIAMELGKGFFKNVNPHCSVFRDSAEASVVLFAAIILFPMLERQIVIDYHSVRNTEGV